MARIKSDLDGCVYVGATPYFAGDVVPVGAVDPLFLEPGVVEAEQPDDAAEGDETPAEAEQADGGDEAPAELGDDPFDPNDHGVRAVRDYLAANPGDAERVLALEAAGQARKSLIGE